VNPRNPGVLDRPLMGGLGVLVRGGRVGDELEVIQVPVLLGRLAEHGDSILCAVGLAAGERWVDGVGDEAPACYRVVVGAPEPVRMRYKNGGATPPNTYDAKYGRVCLAASPQAVSSRRLKARAQRRRLRNQVVGYSAIVRHILMGETEHDGKTNPVKIGVLLVWQKQDGNRKLLARQAYRLE
jgi:hypothetical protein